MTMHTITDKLLIGWKEWCALPDLTIPAIKTKIDTGAKTSALHAFDIEPFHKRQQLHVRFKVHPLQADSHLIIQCESPVIDKRFVMSSNGHKEHRYVISTPLYLGDCHWNIELTLSNRDPLKFRMLLGREAMQHTVIIDPHRSFCQGQIKKSLLKSLYKK